MLNLNRVTFYSGWALKTSLLAIAITLTTGSLAQATPARVILIRHGEKDSDEESDLNTRGKKRAQKLAIYFSDAANGMVPDFIFAAGKKKPTSSIRSMQTVEPLGTRMNLPVDNDFNKDETDELSEALLGKHKYDGKTILVCWEHKAIPDIVEALGYKPTLKWPKDKNGDGVFDRIWVLTFKKNGSPKFQDLPQKLMSGDSAK